ncbi:NAD(P)-dependent oxidoreductase [Photobacterium sp. WH77]|uniref:NAD-dependent epimerase/dehydratase family protein n=1 Tax=unclassified Photobacterium TaxID=2628852 RepID=UPI001C488FDE|nr:MULTISPECIES: NAD(P)-dependent oxidoreductase [unclassified Photobacterium]MBV7263102.1 NAD(P)-dependent oxidoreductase [Photobacterium sp. WH24]MCG2837619.1 NAD(P)-dependent oxidoreductase [Photobacterium sp. WH77]MCG2845235.1 NAD(P)-dependent oxidoreductase [Photobacterium sp. WH80]
MKVLVAGGNSVLGCYVVRHLIDHGYQVFALSQHPEQDNPLAIPLALQDEHMAGKFDAVICCARPVMAPYAQEKQAPDFSVLMDSIERFAKPNARKLYTSGIEVFGCADECSPDELQFESLTAAEKEVPVLKKAIELSWTPVFVPTLVYGGHECPIHTSLNRRESLRIPVLIPSYGLYYAAHLDDLAAFHVTLIEKDTLAPFYFLAEEKRYSPENLADMLVKYGWAEGVKCLSLPSFLKQYGEEVLEVETMNVSVPISPDFEPFNSLSAYLSQTRITPAHDLP